MFVFTNSCLTSIICFICLFLQVFVSLIILGKDLFAILLLIVYVGAISVLFLFVLMTTELVTKIIGKSAATVIKKNIFVLLQVFYNKLLSLLTTNVNKNITYNSPKDMLLAISLFDQIKKVFYIHIHLVWFILFLLISMFLSLEVTIAQGLKVLSPYQYLKSFSSYYNYDAQSLSFAYGLDYYEFSGISRLGSFCISFFTDYSFLLYISGFFLLTSTICVIDLVLPRTANK